MFRLAHITSQKLSVCLSLCMCLCVNLGGPVFLVKSQLLYVQTYGICMVSGHLPQITPPDTLWKIPQKISPNKPHFREFP